MGLRRVGHDWSDLARMQLAHRGVQIVSATGSQRRRWFPRLAPFSQNSPYVSINILKYWVLSFTHHTFETYKSCIENYPLLCPLSGLQTLQTASWGFCFHLCAFPWCSVHPQTEAFLSPVSHFDQGQAPPTTSMSVSCLSWPQKLHFVPRSMPHLVTTQDSSAPMLWYEEKTLI